MDARQNSKFYMALAVKRVLDNNAATIAYPLALENKRTVLATLLTNIPETAQDQELDISGVTVNKDDLKEAMAKAALVVAKPLAAWAHDNEAEVLLAEINFEFSDLYYQRDALCIKHCDLVFEKANPALIDLTDYGVTAAMLAAVESTTLAFTDAWPA